MKAMRVSEKATARLPAEKYRIDFNNRDVLNGNSVERIDHPFLPGVAIVK